MSNTFRNNDITVRDDFHAVHWHRNMIASWVPKFLAYFKTHARVPRRDDRVTEWHYCLTGDLRYHSRQKIILDRAFLTESKTPGIIARPGHALRSIAVLLSMHFHYFRPRREPSGFPIVAVLAEPHFRSDQQNPPIQKGHSAVVGHVLMHHRHAHVNQYIFANAGFQESRQNLPAMEQRVWLVEMVLAAVTAVKRILGCNCDKITHQQSWIVTS